MSFLALLKQSECAKKANKAKEAWNQEVSAQKGAKKVRRKPPGRKRPTFLRTYPRPKMTLNPLILGFLRFPRFFRTLSCRNPSHARTWTPPNGKANMSPSRQWRFATGAMAR